jgi:hypothetical protein
MLKRIGEQADGRKTVRELIDALFARIEKEGLEAISPFRGQHPGDLALPRPFEVAGALNRLRSLTVRTEAKS